MSKEREALKLALEALEKHKAYGTTYPADHEAIAVIKEVLEKQEQKYPFGVYGAEDLDRAWKSGYDNCKAQALWTLEDVKKAWKRGYAAAKKYKLDLTQKSKEALAQPEQEPDVSHKLKFDCEFVDGTCADLTVYGSERDIKRLEARIKFWWNLEQHSGTPDSDKGERIIWGKPPQRTWVGLTDEEMFKTWLTVPAETEDRLAFGRAVEAKLKEKNT